MRLSTYLRLAAATLVLSPAALAQSGKAADKPGAQTARTSLAPPANDNFANATPITAPGLQTLSSTIDATLEPGEPTIPASCGDDNTGKSVWYKFTGGGTPLTFDTANSALAPGGTAIGFVDTIMSIYTGTTLTSLTQVACNDDDPTNPTGGGDFTSRIENLPTISGTSYYVRVSSYFGGAGAFDRSNGEVRLTVTGSLAPVTGPALSANPATLSFGTAQTVGTTSAPQTVTLTNPGTAATTVTGITSSNPAFAVTAGTFPITIAAGATSTFTVRFTPTNTTAQTGTISVASNAPGSPLTIAVSGTGNADVTTQIPPGTTVGGPIWARPTNLGTGASGSCTVASGTAAGSAVRYVTRPFTVSTAGSYTITADYRANTAPTFDGWIDLYQGTFNPADPCLNHVAFDDDYNFGSGSGLVGSQIAAQALTAGSYTLVITGYGNTAAGTFIGDVVGPAVVNFTPVAGEGTAQNALASLSATPNPVRDAARVRFTAATAQDVTVAVYDVTGRQVATLFQGAVAADQTVEARLDAANLPSGVYVVRASGTDVNMTQRVTVVR